MVRAKVREPLSIMLGLIPTLISASTLRPTLMLMLTLVLMPTLNYKLR